MLRQEEHRALGLPAEELPRVLDARPAIELTAERWPGTQTTAVHLLGFADALAERFGLPMESEALNLWGDSPIALPDPLELPRTRGSSRRFSPVILERRALGFALLNERHRKRPLVHVFSHTRLRDRLELRDGSRVRVQFVPASALPPRPSGADPC